MNAGEIDYAIQSAILHSLAPHYPNRSTAWQKVEAPSAPALVANLQYLHEHRLVVAESVDVIYGPKRFGNATITQRGLDSSRRTAV